MAAVVVVHGIGQQYEGPETLHLPLARSLRDGVGFAGLVPPAVEDIRTAFYGDVFRASGGKGASDPSSDEGDPNDPNDPNDPFEADLARAWWAAAALIDRDHVQRPDDVEGAKARTPLTVKAALRALSMSRFATRLTERALRGTLRQVRDYLHDPDIRARVQAAVSAEITKDTRVVVGHSLGSVVAYEVLCARPDDPARVLVTLGSPLGIRHLVFDRLQPTPVAGRGPWPGCVARWTNVCDRNDVVALVERLGPLFDGDEGAVEDLSVDVDADAEQARAVEDLTVDNGWEAHSLAHYLTARRTGAAIGRGLLL
ncbi:hypothetical protein [Streptomyces sp. SD15]